MKRPCWAWILLLSGVLGAQTARAQVAAGIQPAETSQFAALEFRPAPDFELTNSDGSGIRLSDFRGRVVVLQFWARWCTSCEGDLRAFQQIHRNTSDREVAILGLGHASGSRGEIKQFAESLGVTFPMLLCTDEVRSDYQVAVFPTTFLIDRQGRIRDRRVGALESGYWQQRVEELIADS